MFNPACGWISPECDFPCRPCCLQSHKILCSAALCLAPLAATAGDPLAEIVSVEVLPGWRAADGSHMAALRIRLSPGWKTYWRSPGDAGIAPDFDWRGSQNLRAVRYHWPRPEVFDLNGQRTLGYDGELILPVEVWATDESLPTHLSTTLHIGVCRDVCVPATVAVTGRLTPDQRTGDAAIRSALASGPETPRQARVSGHGCDITPIKGGVRVTATVDLPSVGAGELAVIETSDRGLWVSEAVTRRDGGRLTAVADLYALDGGPIMIDRDAMTISVISSARSVEIRGCPTR